MVLPTGVSPRLGQALRQRFSGCGESRCAYKLRLSAAMYAQMYAQSWVRFRVGVDWSKVSCPYHSMLTLLVMPQQLGKINLITLLFAGHLFLLVLPPEKQLDFPC
jgi:hypothetical protein